MFKCLHEYMFTFLLGLPRSGMAGSHHRCVFHSCMKPSYFSRVIVPFYISINCEGDFQYLSSSVTLGSLSQKSYNVLQKTQTSQHFPTIQVKHIKCLHENSKLTFSHRRLPTLLLSTNHQPCCFVFQNPVMVFL